jgi:hypothetical protein
MQNDTYANEARLRRHRQAMLDGLVDYATAAAEIRGLKAELAVRNRVRTTRTR